MSVDKEDFLRGEPINETGDPSLDRSSEELIEMFDGWLDESRPHWRDWRKRAEIDFRFEAGDQYDQETKSKLAESNRVAPVFNRIRPMCEAIAGAEIANRQEVQFSPREVTDTGYAQFVGDAVDYIRENGDAEDEESEAFYDTIVCGVGIMSMGVSYDETRSGDIKYDHRDPMKLTVDARSKKANFADARYFCYDHDMSPDEFYEIYGEDAEYGTQDTRRAAQEHRRYNRDQLSQGADDYDYEGGNVEDAVVTEWQWWEREARYLIQDTDPLTGQVNTAELSEDQHDALMEAAEGHGITITAQRITQRRYFRAFVSNGEVLQFEENPANQFTYLFITGKRNRDTNHHVGIVRSLVDPQQIANKLWSVIAHILDSNAKGGVIAEVGVSEDRRAFEESYAAADSISWAENDSVRDGRIMPKPQAPLPVGYQFLMQNAVDAMPQVSGVNEEILGLAGREQPGVLEAQRKQAAYGVMGRLFNNLRRFRKDQGRLSLRMLPYLGEQIIRIVGPNHKPEYIRFVMQEDPSKFDVVADDGPTSPNRKASILEVLMRIAPLFKGLPGAQQLLAEVVQYLPELPESMTAKMAEILSQPNPAQQMQQQMAAQKAQIEMQGAQASAQKDMAGAGKASAEAAQIQMETALAQEEANRQAIFDQALIGIGGIQNGR